MPLAELVDGRISIDVPLREKPLIQTLPGARWHDPSKRWRMPLSWASCKMLRGVFGPRLEVGLALCEWAIGEFEGRVQPATGLRSLALDPAADVEGDARLYPFQRTGVAFLSAAGSAILGDEMGTGKSVQTAVALEKLDAWPALIVCPKSMQRTWARELWKWARVETLVLEGSAAKRRAMLENVAAGDVAVIATYDLIRSHSRLAGYGSIKLTDEEKQPKELNGIPFRAVVADEAHRAKDPKAKQTRALWALGDAAYHRFALTGTPIANQMDEFWSLLRFVSPDEWTVRTGFIERYCLKSFNPWGGLEVLGLNPANETELREIMEPRFLRRPKALVLPHLPPKLYERRDVEMGAKQAKAYRQLADGMVADLDSGKLVTFSPLVQGGRLTQFASALCDVEETGEFDDEGFPKIRVVMGEPSPKLDAMLEVLDELGDEPLAVFASSRQLIDLAGHRLTKAGVPFTQVVGGMHTAERQDSIDTYNKGQARVILISIGAGAEGMSLTRGTTELFLDRSWSQLQNAQAEDRLHGTGRGDADAEKLTIIDLITKDTIEEHRVDVLAGKAEQLEDLVRDRDLLRAALAHGGKTTRRKAA